MEHAATGFLPCAPLFPLRVLRCCCACYPSRCAHYASPRCASLLTPFVLFSADVVPAADPVLPNAAFVARAAVPVTSCLTAVVSHAVPRWVADLGLPSARQSSSGASAASALRPTASAAAAIAVAAIAAAAASAGYGPASRHRTTAVVSGKSNRDSSNSKCKHRFSLPHPGHVRGSPSAATSRTESGPTKTAAFAPKAPTGHGCVPLVNGC